MELRRCGGIAGTALLVGTLLVSGGCGLKTDPVPPQSVVPQAVNDLRYTLDEDGATLSWTYPRETIDGQDITAIDGFDLYRAEIPLDDYCASCPIPFGEPMKLPGDVVGDEPAKKVTHFSGLLRSGNKYFFKVKSRSSWWAASADSNIVSFVYHTPAAAPGDVQAQMKGGGVKLSWSPVTTLVDGSSAEYPVSYTVLRGEQGQAPTTLASVETSSYVDNAVKTGATYSYKVRSNMQLDGEVLEGTLSDAVAVKVVDTVPPPVVSGVRVVASANDIRVFWNRVKADDLAGYRIYRRADGETKAVMVGETAGSGTLYTDSGAPEAKLFYSVTAVDKEGNESKPSKEASARYR